MGYHCGHWKFILGSMGEDVLQTHVSKDHHLHKQHSRTATRTKNLDVKVSKLILENRIISVESGFQKIEEKGESVS